MGTWAIPKEDEDFNKISKAIEIVKELKYSLYSVCGSDDLFDCFDGALKILRALKP